VYAPYGNQSAIEDYFSTENDYERFVTMENGKVIITVKKKEENEKGEY
jgi:hypothetical protein